MVGMLYRSIGNEFFSRGMTDSAVGYYRLALRYEPGDAGIRGDLDRALGAANRPKEASAGAGGELRPTPSATAEAKSPPAPSTRGVQSER